MFAQKHYINLRTMFDIGSDARINSYNLKFQIRSKRLAVIKLH